MSNSTQSRPQSVGSGSPQSRAVNAAQARMEHPSALTPGSKNASSASSYVDASNVDRKADLWRCLSSTSFDSGFFYPISIYAFLASSLDGFVSSLPLSHFHSFPLCSKYYHDTFFQSIYTEWLAFLYVKWGNKNPFEKARIWITSEIFAVSSESKVEINTKKARARVIFRKRQERNEHKWSSDDGHRLEPEAVHWEHSERFNEVNVQRLYLRR